MRTLFLVVALTISAFAQLGAIEPSIVVKDESGYWLYHTASKSSRAIPEINAFNLHNSEYLTLPMRNGILFTVTDPRDVDYTGLAQAGSEVDDGKPILRRGTRLYYFEMASRTVRQISVPIRVSRVHFKEQTDLSVSHNLTAGLGIVGKSSDESLVFYTANQKLYEYSFITGKSVVVPVAVEYDLSYISHFILEGDLAILYTDLYIGVMAKLYTKQAGFYKPLSISLNAVGSSNKTANFASSTYGTMMPMGIIGSTVIIETSEDFMADQPRTKVISYDVSRKTEKVTAIDHLENASLHFLDGNPYLANDSELLLLDNALGIRRRWNIPRRPGQELRFSGAVAKAWTFGDVAVEYDLTSGKQRPLPGLIKQPEHPRIFDAFKGNWDEMPLLYNLPAGTSWYMSRHNNLRFRSSPRLDGEVIRSFNHFEALEILERGEALQVDGIQGHWVKVKTWHGETGYCFDGYLAPVKL